MIAQVTLGDFIAHPAVLLVIASLIGAIGWGSQRVVNRLDRFDHRLDRIDHRLDDASTEREKVRTDLTAHMAAEDAFHQLDSLDRATRQAALDVRLDSFDEWRGTVDDRLAGIEGRLPHD